MGGEGELSSRPRGTDLSAALSDDKKRLHGAGARIHAAKFLRRDRDRASLFPHAGLLISWKKQLYYRLQYSRRGCFTRFRDTEGVFPRKLTVSDWTARGLRDVGWLMIDR